MSGQIDLSCHACLRLHRGNVIQERSTIGGIGNVTFSKHDGPNCYNPSNASSAGSPYPLGSGLWNSGACPIEPTTSPNYPDNTTLGNAYPDEIYLAVAAPNGVSTVLVPVNRYVTSGGAANYTNVAITFSDAAAQAIPTGSTPVSGSFRPITAFSAYNNIDPEGNWVLTFGDNYSEDPFRIVNWGVTITYDEPPTLRLTKVSNGGVGTFTFTGNNGWSSQSITTATAGVGVAGATQSLSAAATATTLTEALPVGWQLSGVSCTGMGSGGTATVAGSSFTLNAAAMASNADILCTVTNARIPVLRLSKSLPDGRVHSRAAVGRGRGRHAAVPGDGERAAVAPARVPGSPAGALPGLSGQVKGFQVLYMNTVF